MNEQIEPFILVLDLSLTFSKLVKTVVMFLVKLTIRVFKFVVH